VEALSQAKTAKVHNLETLLSSPRALKSKQQELGQAFKFQEEQKDKLTDMLQQLESFTVTSDEMNPKLNPDAMYFEQAVEAINQANKFS
jgi:hypothetical protein